MAKKYKDNNFVLNAIKDSKISEEEIAESYNIIKSCYSAHNVKFETDLQDRWTGQDSIIAPKDMSQDEFGNVKNTCEQKSGFADLSELSNDLVRNPNNQNSISLTVKCLVKHELVPQSYNMDDYQRDFQDSGNANPKKGNALVEYISENATEDNKNKFISCQENPLDIASYPVKYDWAKGVFHSKIEKK